MHNCDQEKDTPLLSNDLVVFSGSRVLLVTGKKIGFRQHFTLMLGVTPETWPIPNCLLSKADVCSMQFCNNLISELVTFTIAYFTSKISSSVSFSGFSIVMHEWKRKFSDTNHLVQALFVFKLRFTAMKRL